ncbi:VIT1/CCC1 transporter family protein [Candidatus Saccharibacteria bacterium]|nr:VIT1/CCC1 transporter family protein [Candidatus Saccharibacteria bacterium]
MKRHHFRIRHRDHRFGALLSFIDGLEGGFAIFAGIVAGLSFSMVNRSALIVTAWVGIVVNAVNAATIRYSSEHYYDELDGHEKRDRFRAYFMPAVIEFLIYMFVSALSLLPLLFIDHLSTALFTMVIVCVGILFVAGAIRGRLLGGSWLRDGLEIMFGGLVMIAIGTTAGWFLSHAFGH